MGKIDGDAFTGAALYMPIGLFQIPFSDVLVFYMLHYPFHVSYIWLLLIIIFSHPIQHTAFIYLSFIALQATFDFRGAR